MKIRTDFLIDSSSFSFILSRKGTLTPAQKEAIVKFIEETFVSQKCSEYDSLFLETGMLQTKTSDIPIPDASEIALLSSPTMEWDDSSAFCKRSDHKK